MKHIAAAVIAAALLFSASALAAGKVKATEGSVNVRTGPGLDYESISTLAQGRSLDFAGERAFDDRGVEWYLVFVGSDTGWVSSLYTELDMPDDSPSARYAVSVGGSSNIRKSPDLDGAVLGTLPENGSAEYLGEIETDDRGVDWYYITYNGTTGWVSSRYTVLK